MKSPTKLPKHIAIIMDGNRRWARQHAFSMIKGHTKGIDVLEPLIAYASEVGIPYMTFWAFSTENWNRGSVEVQMLMEVFRKFFKGPLPKRLMQKGVKIQVLGDYKVFPEDIVANLEELIANSSDNAKITINIALNYGGRMEITRAVQQIVSDKIKKEDITEDLISQYLYTKDVPDPDLIIRTGGALRLSGYFPWQSVYSELYFTDTLWPDFTPQSLEEALEEYSDRDRRFGK